MKKTALALIALSAFSALAGGTTKFARMHDNDTVVTNAWQAIEENVEELRIEAQKALDDSMVTFSYDVWACDHEIPSGTVSSMSESIQAELKDVYGDWVLNEKLAVPMTSSMTYTFSIRTMMRPEASDLSIDWGDGEISRVKDMTWSQGQNYFENSAKNEIYYTFIHTYRANGVYTVRYLGKDWHAITHNTTSATGALYPSADGASNLVCRVFDINCPVPAHVKNFSNMFVNSKKLLKINARYNYPIRFGNNSSTMFNGCENLIDGGYILYRALASNCGSMFNNCKNMRTIGEPKIPNGLIESIANMYAGCANLSIDISKTVVFKFENNSVAANGAFKNCLGMTGTVPSNLLWEDTSVQWTPASLYLTNGVVNADGPFFGCSDAIREQVPLSWGGSNASIKVPAYTGEHSGGGGGGSGGSLSTNEVLSVFDPEIISEIKPDPKQEVDYLITVKNNKLTTILPTNSVELTGMELAIETTGSRNYSLFIPNEEELRVGLPIAIMGDTGVNVRIAGGNGTNVINRLPARIDMATPYPKISLLTITEINDGSDWTPVVTNSFYLPVDGTFTCGTSRNAVDGYNLHNCTNFFLRYPTSATESRKFAVMPGATTKPKSGTFYNSFSASNIVNCPAPDLYWTDGGTKTWFEIEFHTTHGIGIYRQEYVKED